MSYMIENGNENEGLVEIVCMHIRVSSPGLV